MIQRLTFLSRFALAGFICGIVPLAASAQNKDALSAKVDTLISTTERNNQEVARAMNLLTQIQQEFQSIRGTVEAAKVLQKEGDKVYQDLDIRVSSLEDKINQIHQMLREMRSGGAPAGPTGAAPGAAPSAQAMKELEDFQALLNVVNAEDFRGAASGFMGFLRKYPQSAMAGSAQYWVAESFYSMGDFTKAISEFQILVDKYPQNPRAKEAIYKQGSAFMRLKKYDEAKLFFQKVMGQYPGSAEALQAQARMLRIDELQQGASLASAQGQSPAPGAATSKPVAPGGAPAGNPNAPATPVTPPSSNAPPEPARPTHDGGAPLF